MHHRFVGQSASSVNFRKFGQRCTGKGRVFVYDQDAPICGEVVIGQDQTDVVREDGKQITFMREAVAYVEWD